MAILTVIKSYDAINPVPGTYPSIEAALLDASPGDTIILGPNYSDEEVIITKSDISISGTTSSLGIMLIIADGSSGLVFTGNASIEVKGSNGDDIITGNDGDNVITLTGGVDIVDGGLGDYRLVVDYSASAAVVTATNATIVGGPGTVAITGIEHYTMLTGAGDDILTLTTAHGDNYIDAGEGANTIVVRNGTNTIITGSGIDTISAGDGDNYIDLGVGTIGANTIAVWSGNNTIHGSLGIS